jgi:threonine dehydrogenase-like Zn-dependent dehydrogenase
VEEFAAHWLPLAEAPTAYEVFQNQADGVIKIMFKPWA